MITAPRTTRAGQRIEHLSDLIIEELQPAGSGHCVRINYLSADEAAAVCQFIRDHRDDALDDLHVYLLTSRDQESNDSVSITADRAIELRNRKIGCLCLFVPSDLIDATASSIGNSFAEIDGRNLHKQALQLVRNAMGTDARQGFQAISSELTGTSWASDDEKLDLALVVSEFEEHEDLDKLGLELWRVGLITDARPDFTSYLRDNRTHVRKLARPQRLSAPHRDRIQSLGVNDRTASHLEDFFANRAMHDVRSWSRDLVAADLTLDRWEFAASQSDSDLAAVEVSPFTKPDGSVIPRTKLHQKDGPGGALLANAGEGKKITVHWSTTPAKPREIDAWRVEMVPSEPDSNDDDLDLLDLPSRQVRGNQRKSDIRLDFDTVDLPQTGFRIQVTAVDPSGSEMRNQQNEVTAALSDEFYLISSAEDDLDLGTTTRRRTVSTLALGRLDAAVEAKGQELEFDSPSWVPAGDRHYFSIKARPRTMLNIELSGLLRDLEWQTLGQPSSGGRWHLHVDETAPVTDSSKFRLVDPGSNQDEAWNAFWRARRTMFDRIRKRESRYVLEAIEWNQDQLNGAINYAQAYATLLDSLPQEQLHDALSIDTLHLQIDRTGPDEHALVILPTHPMRTVWFAIHASLLRSWEDDLLGLDRKRKQAIDLDLVGELSPLNTPPFVYSAIADQPFVFFQNLNTFFGVAFPARTFDPVRRMNDLASILGVGEPDQGDDGRRPHYLGRQLQRYREGHSYADPMVLALVNSDRGEFLAGTIQEMFRQELTSNDEDEQQALLALDVTAYVPGDRISRLSDMDHIRAMLSERSTRVPTDALRPALATSVKSYDTLSDERIAPAHVAMVADISRPNVVPVRADDLETGSTTASLSMYGLVARFVGSFQATSEGLAWTYVVSPWGTMRGDAHPSGPRFGRVLPDAFLSFLGAVGRCLDSYGSENTLPSVQIDIDDNTSDFLERLHRSSDWVITIDRFFGVEYYDSPNVSVVRDLAQKHVIDYSPEFSDGLSHRAIVTTVWRDEVNRLLKSALNELGFAAVDQSVRTLLHYLKLISGRLALQAASPTTTGTAAMSLSAVVAWLRAQGRLTNSVVIPVDHHQGLFRANSKGAIQEGQRRCDLLLVGFRRGIIDATFIEVKWRRGETGSLEGDASEMKMQMEVTARGFEDRFFNSERVDGSLQRANLANTLRFYGRRALRHGLISADSWATMVSHIEQLERTSVELRVTHEGFIVNLDRPIMGPIDFGDNVTIRVLTAQDFEDVSPVLVSGKTVASTPVEQTESSQNNKATNDTSASLDNASTANNAEEDDADPNGQGQGVPEESSSNDMKVGTTGAVTSRAGTEVMLGTSISGQVSWSPSVTGSPHLFITGIPGQGKSWTIMRILNQLSTDNVPALIFDFHGQFGDQESTYVQQASPIVMDAALGLPFSPFESNESSMATNWRATAHGVSEIFGYVCKLGEIQQDVLYRCIRGAYEAHGFGNESPETLTSYPSLHEVLHRIEQMENQSQTQNLTARLRPLFEMDIFHHDPDNQPDLIETIRHGLVLDLHELHSDMLQLMAGAFILRKLYRDMFQWGVADRLRLVVVLDEAHRLARDITLPKLMKEGRKFGIAVVVASQGLGDFHPDIVNNAGTKIAFRANHNESRKIAGFFRGRPGQNLSEILEGLNVGQALVQTADMNTVARTQMAPPDND